MWIYEARPGIVLVSVFALLFALSYLGLRLGVLAKRKLPNTPELPEFIPSTILGLLALILAFTFSMAAYRFEERIRLGVDEANAIGTAYRRAGFLRSNGKEITDRLTRYLDLRIAHDQAPIHGPRARELDVQTANEEDEIWKLSLQATQHDHGPIESILIQSLNSAFDLRNTRTFALRRELPGTIYRTILFIAAMGICTFNFRRGQRQEGAQLQAAIMALVIALPYALILDLDRPSSGSIRISQDAMTELRDSIGRR